MPGTRVRVECLVTGGSGHSRWVEPVLHAVPDSVCSAHPRRTTLPWLAGGCALLLLAAATTAQGPATPPPKKQAARQPVADEQGAIITARSPQLFAVLCALYAAQFEADVAFVSPHPLHVRLRREMAALQGPAVNALREFYRKTRSADPSVTLSRYVSYALVTGPPPRFEYQLTLEQLPPDVRALDGLTPLLAEFYNEAGIAELFRTTAQEYQAEIRRLRVPLGEMVFRSAGYLRELVDQAGVRQFTVFVEPLVGVKTNLRNYGDQYAVVVSPAQDFPMDDIRHGFLHFLLDPLPYRHRTEVERLRPLLAYAGRAPRFPAEYREQFPSFVVECLVRAVELRLQSLSAGRIAEGLQSADADGFILVRPLYERLKEFETAEPAMTFYFPDMLAGVDLPSEAARLEKVTFAPALNAAPRVSEPVVQLSETERLLAEGEALIADRKPDEADVTFRAVLAKEPENPRALYGAGIAAALLRDVERAKGLFQQVIAGAAEGRYRPADMRWLAWSHVYLGRIYDVEGKRELALTEFRAALAIAEAPEDVRAAAQRGIEHGYRPARPESKP